MGGFVFWGTSIQWVGLLAVLWAMFSLPVVLAPRR